MKSEDRYDSLILFYAEVFGRDPRQVKRQIRKESNFHPCATSSAGAKGLCQFLPGTWAGTVIHDNHTSSLIFDPEAQIRTACKFMASLERHLKGLDKALAAYNWGAGHLVGVIDHGEDWLRFSPAETQDYVAFCMDYLGETLLGWTPPSPTP